MVFPIFTNILSIFVLNEKFSSKYLVACLFCFLGCIAFTFSEKNSNISHGDSSAAAALAAESELNYKIILGIFFAVLDGFFSSIMSISTKFLMKEMNSIQSNMYIGFYLRFVCLFCALFSFRSFVSDLFDFFFVLQSAVNGFVVYGAFHFLSEAVENADLSKTSYICYTQVIFNILFGLIFFGEAFYFLDFLGFMMIIGTNVYLTFYSKRE
jgi:drug/metabolite transporter (DMT)-like permease